MATILDAQIVEACIRYTFRTDGLLIQALTAGGAVEGNREGNRTLALLGTSLIQFLLVYIGYEARAERSSTSDVKCRLSSNEHRAAVAKRTGIDKCIKYSERHGGRSTKVLAKAIDAIIGATFVDSSGDMKVALQAMVLLGVFVLPVDAIDPNVLSMTTFPENLNLSILTQQLLSNGLDGISSQSLSILYRTNIHDPSSNFGNDVDPMSEPDRSAGDNLFHLDLSSALQWTEDLTVSEEHGATPQVGIGLIEIQAIGNLTAPENAIFPQMTTVQSGPEMAQVENVPIIEPDGEVAEVTDGEIGRRALDIDKQGVSIPRLTDARQIGLQSSSKRKSTSTFSTMKKTRPISSIEFQSSDDAFAAYLTQETARCQNHGLPSPEQTYFTPEIQRRVRSFDHGKQEMLKKMIFHFAGPHSIAVLQDMLLNYREHADADVLQHQDQMSKSDRFALIEKMDKKLAYFQLFQRYHVLQLFKESGGPETLARTGQLVLSMEDFPQPRKKAGNPILNAEAKVTEKMIKDIFPGLDPKSHEYQGKHRVITRIRKLGQRLHALEKKFGDGIIGLIPNSTLTGGLEIAVSDNMMIQTPDGVFEQFVNLLDESQGESLRQFSMAVSSIVKVLIHKPLLQREAFELENVRTSEILELPKGSSQLLQLIG